MYNAIYTQYTQAGILRYPFYIELHAYDRLSAVKRLPVRHSQEKVLSAFDALSSRCLYSTFVYTGIVEHLCRPLGAANICTLRRHVVCCASHSDQLLRKHVWHWHTATATPGHSAPQTLAFATQQSFLVGFVIKCVDLVKSLWLNRRATAQL